MAKTKLQKELTGVVENFIGLWNRYYSLYLEGVSKQDITSEKENEFLKFQGTMVEQLVNVLELDPRPRFDVHDKVMTVIHDVVSLDLYTKMSEFQVTRTKQQWQEAMEELKTAEKLYRDSLPDITHHHLKLIYSLKLWASILNSSIRGWKIRNIIDEKTFDRLQKKRIQTLIFYFLRLVPFLGSFLSKLWGRKDYRQHYAKLLTSPGYFRRAMRARIAEADPHCGRPGL